MLLADNFAAVSSRLTAAPSNQSQYQNVCMVSGKEVIRRLEGPEKMTHTVLCQVLRIGKGSDSAKKLADLVTRLGLNSAKNKYKTSSADYTAYSVLTEGKEMLISLVTSKV